MCLVLIIKRFELCWVQFSLPMDLLLLVVSSDVVPHLALHLFQECLTSSLCVLGWQFSLGSLVFLLHVAVLFLEDLIRDSVLAYSLLLSLGFDAFLVFFRLLVESLQCLTFNLKILPEKFDALDEFLSFPRLGPGSWLLWRGRPL